MACGRAEEHLAKGGASGYFTRIDACVRLPRHSAHRRHTQNTTRPTGVNGVIMSKTKQPESYHLVFSAPGKKKEEILFTSTKLLDVELKREQHIRSITTGYVEIRKA